MKHRLFFIEGLPGSGKTFRAEELRCAFQQKKKTVTRLTECEKNPLDLARCAIMTEKEYAEICHKLAEEHQMDQNKVDELLQELESVSDHVEGKVYIFFQLLFENKELNSLALALRNYDFYNGHHSFELFQEEHLKRWCAFSSLAEKDNETYYICDAILLQSPLFELMGYYDLSYDSIFQYISTLLSCVKQLSPIIYYHRISDLPTAMHYICERRKNENDRWERGFYKWMESSPYCQKRNYHGFDGMCTFLAERQTLELQMLEHLSVPHIIFERDIQ